MRRNLILSFAAFAAAAILPTSASADVCLGEPCPYTQVGQVGQSGNGVLRFPQAVAVGSDGNVYVGDQSSRVIQVFTKDGQFVRQFGTPGTQPGQITAVSSIAVAPNGTIGVTDGGTNRVVLYASTGAVFGSIGGSGNAVGQFRFGAGGGNDSPAGGAITFDKGRFYISDSGNDRIQRMNLDGTNQMILIDTGQLAHPRGLTVRGDNLIVADDQNHRLAVFGLDGAFRKSVGLGKGARPGQLSFPFGVAVDYSGRTFVADDMNQRVVRFGAPPNFKYKARWGSYGTAPGQFAFPRAIAADPQGRVYVTNTGNDRIDVFDGTGKRLSTFGSSGRAPGQFNTPAGVAVDSSGIRAVADTINGRVQLLNPDGTVASIWGSPNPGPTILKRPVDVVFDAAGNGFVLDQRRSQIIAYDRASALSTATIGAQGSGPGKLLGPSAIARSADGTLWVADTGNSRIVRFTPGGTALGSFPTPEPPRGIAISPDGSRVYVTTTRSRVEVFDNAGNPITRFAYNGRKLGQLNSPAGITVDAAGSLWIADRGNSRIAHFSAEGKRLGTFGARGSGPGAIMSGPTGVAVDCRGVLSVTDTRNNIVRTFALTTTPPGSACSQLPSPGPPPLLQYPTLPAPDGPVIEARSLRRTSLLGRGLALRAGCDTTCTLSVSATISQNGLPPKRKGQKKRRPVSVMLPPAKLAVEGGTSKIIRLKANARAVKTLKRALAGKRGVAASVTLTATAEVGEPTSYSIRINGTR